MDPEQRGLMNRESGKTFREGWRYLILMLLAALALSGAPRALALTSSAIQIGVSYKSPAAKQPRTWQFPYDDAMFLAPASQYRHPLAQSSLGMALSAFRNRQAPLKGQGEQVRAFLSQAGFEDLEGQDYHRRPSVDTIATMIGNKWIEDGEFTLVAVAVSGGGYQDEWMSNFTIGDEERHVGFNQAAQKVETRIRAYLEEEGIAGPVKLWISGYSRAAAVSNLVAADMTDSGLFADVFAYTFATPRTTKAGGGYANIFNITGKFDPVPHVPFAEWGYGRYGVDLYTPAQETDSDYRQRKERADIVSRALTGSAFWNSTEMNANLHSLLDYLLDILSTSAMYEQYMQPIMLSAWKDRSVPNLSSVLFTLMEDANLLSQAVREELDSLVDYLSMVTYEVMADSVAGGAGWNANTGLADNLMHEHNPDVYLAWMFSSNDPAQVFTDEDQYLRLTYQGKAGATLYDQEGSFLLYIDHRGRVSDQPREDHLEPVKPVDQRPLISVTRKGTQTIIALPKDSAYLLSLQAEATERLMYFGTQYSINGMHGRLDDIRYVEMKEGEQYLAISLEKGDDINGEEILGDVDFTINPWTEDMPYSPAMLLMLENMNVFHLTWKQMGAIAGGALAVVLAAMALAALKLMKRRRRKRQQKAQ